MYLCVAEQALIQRPKDGATVAAELIMAERPPGECDPLLNNRYSVNLRVALVCSSGLKHVLVCVDDLWYFHFFYMI